MHSSTKHVLPNTPSPTFTPVGALSPPGPVVHVINQPFWCLLSGWRPLLMPLSQRSQPGRQLSEQCNTTCLCCMQSHHWKPLGTHTDHWRRSSAYHLDTCTIQLPKHGHVATPYRIYRYTIALWCTMKKDPSSNYFSIRSPTRNEKVRIQCLGQRHIEIKNLPTSSSHDTENNTETKFYIISCNNLELL